MNEILYTHSVFNKYAHEGIRQSLINCNPENKKPIFVCIGSDLVLGDSLGPLVGTLLRKKAVRSYIYGTLNYPITSKEVEYARTCVKQMHPNSITIAIDAAVGGAEDIGLVRVLNKGLKPGLGVDKNLGIIGDISIIGVVAEKSLKNYNLFNLTRLNLIYKMAECIANGVADYLSYINSGGADNFSSFGA
ncbi:MAG: spore protease YyaC [Clostridiales bacterium]|nr:spore protease YyaC [Clostridiales bacterium]